MFIGFWNILEVEYIPWYTLFSENPHVPVLNNLRHFILSQARNEKPAFRRVFDYVRWIIFVFSAPQAGRLCSTSLCLR